MVSSLSMVNQNSPLAFCMAKFMAICLPWFFCLKYLIGIIFSLHHNSPSFSVLSLEPSSTIIHSKFDELLHFNCFNDSYVLGIVLFLLNVGVNIVTL